MEVKYPNEDTEQMVGWVIESATKEIQGWIHGERGHLINQNNEEKMNLVSAQKSNQGWAEAFPDLLPKSTPKNTLSGFVKTSF